MIAIDEQLSLKKHARETSIPLSRYPYQKRQYYRQSIENLFKSQSSISHLNQNNRKEVKNSFYQNPELISHVLVNFAKHIQILEGESLSQLPSLDVAKYSLEMACNLSPDLIEPYLELGYFEYAICDRAREALEYFNIASEKIAQHPIDKYRRELKQILIGKIKCYIDLNNYDRAREELEKAQTLCPDDSQLEILEYELEEYEYDS